MPEPLVLLHGLAMSGRAWLPVVQGLSADRTVHTPTLPGHRGGPPARRPVTVSSLTDAVEAYLDEHHLARPHLVGNSLGGWVSLELARRHRARSVTAISPGGAWSSGLDLLRMAVGVRTGAWMLANRMNGVSVRQPQARRALLLGLMERGDRLSVTDALELLRDVRGCEVVGDVLRIAFRDGPVAALQAADCPVQVVWGERDRTLPYGGFGRAIAGLVTTTPVVVLPRAGHVPMYDCPRRLQEIILTHATSAEASSINLRRQL